MAIMWNYAKDLKHMFYFRITFSLIFSFFSCYGNSLLLFDFSCKTDLKSMATFKGGVATIIRFGRF